MGANYLKHEEEKNKIKKTVHLLKGRNRKFTALKFPRLCPFVRLATVGWRQCRTDGCGKRTA
jgi:hypothetical protein